MKRQLMMAVVCLIAVAGVEAAPWSKGGFLRDWKFYASAGIQVGAEIALHRTSEHCRERAGIGHCLGGYTERGATIGFHVGLQATAMGFGLWLRDEDTKGWWLAPVGMAVFDGVVAGIQTGRRCSTMVGLNGQCVDPDELASAHQRLMR